MAKPVEALRQTVRGLALRAANEARGAVLSVVPVRNRRDPVELAGRLVQIPSDKTIGGRHAERWIKRFAARNLPGFTSNYLSTEQKSTRTLIVANDTLPEYVIVGHIDTVKSWVVGEASGQGK